MANDCLVTKLKSTVNNENLKKLGVLRIPFLGDGTSANLPFIGTDSSVRVTAYDNEGNILATATAVNASTLVRLPFTMSVDGYIEVENKYGLVRLQNINFNAGTIYGTSKSLDELPSIEEYKYMNNLAEVSGSLCYTDIKNIAPLESITSINTTYLTGDFVDYVAEKVRLGHTQGSVTWSCFRENNRRVGKDCTLNGVMIMNYTYGNDESYPNVIEWDGANKIRLRNKATTSGWTYGYTENEVRAMFASGEFFGNKTSVIMCDTGQEVVITKE